MTKGYEVVIGATASKAIARLPKAERGAVLAALATLANDPRAGKALAGELRGLWSLRRGDYRLLYRIDDRARRVEVARVGHRRDIYRR
ncbi:MAG TPA: type II toxin-antitoxin system RelE/ParE family toxin [Candidatus Dormibacteraeota bacterium]|nr:type II toxin-antitoxin system RelE/ParE family toxin [Candidatus Dormibacteraeota bacterium]